MSSLERLDFGPNSDTDDLDDDDDEEDDDNEDDEDDELDGPEEVHGPGIKSPWGSISYLTNEDLKDWLKGANVDEDPSPAEPSIVIETQPNGSPKKKKRDEKMEKKKKASINGQGVQDSKKSRKKEPKFDLEEPEFVPHDKKPTGNVKTTASSLSVSAFGEQTTLNPIDSIDKSVRKKSLQFHTSRIESTSAKRIKARGVAMGGDEDIPYRERDKERELRLQKERNKKAATLGQGGEDLEDIAPHNKLKRPREEEATEMEVDGYYDLVKRQKREKKEEKKSKYDAEKAEEKYTFPFQIIFNYTDQLRLEPPGKDT
jgi:U3 small nucleolar RNA-associated protein 3